MTKPERGQIYFVRAPKNVDGSEQKKDRPALIIGSNEGNRNSTISQMLMIASKEHDDAEGGLKKTHFNIERYEEVGLKKPSVVMAEHIYTVDHSRLLDYKGQLNKKEMYVVERKMLIAQAMSNRYKLKRRYVHKRRNKGKMMYRRKK